MIRKQKSIGRHTAKSCAFFAVLCTRIDVLFRFLRMMTEKTMRVGRNLEQRDFCALLMVDITIIFENCD